MVLEICAVGGYGEVGRNMTAVRVNNDVFILDMGLHMPNYIKFTEEEAGDLQAYSVSDLMSAQAIPDDSVIADWKHLVKAIIVTHAHLDHLGAIPYLAKKYKVPIYCTPFTGSVIRSIVKDQKIILSNPVKTIHPNSKIDLCPAVVLELISVTHSTPQSAVAVLHTSEGIIVYTNDFKLDNSPTLGQMPNYDALRALSKKNVRVMIVDTLYADVEAKTASEKVAKELLTDALLRIDARGRAIVVSTFASHIARLKTISELGRKLHRKVVFIGRSLAKYVSAAEEAGLAQFSKQVEVVSFSSQAGRRLKKIMADGKDKFLLVVTGHQGEPKAILSKMATGLLPFSFDKDDYVVFSSNVIPTSVNQEHRARLEEILRQRGVRILKGLHTSGHGAEEDMRQMISLVKPKIVIPAHSDTHALEAFLHFSEKLGYKEGSTAVKLLNSQRIKIS